MPESYTAFMFYVYLLHSPKNKEYYAGFTSNLVLKMKEYKLQSSIIKLSRKPLILVGYKKFKTEKEAKFFVYKVKRNMDFRKEFIQSSSLVKR